MKTFISLIMSRGYKRVNDDVWQKHSQSEVIEINRSHNTATIYESLATCLSEPLNYLNVCIDTIALERELDALFKSWLAELVCTGGIEPVLVNPICLVEADTAADNWLDGYVLQPY